MSKTNVIRILESQSISYSAHEYDVSEDDLSGPSVAQKINASEDEVFKTLVARGDKTGVVVFCIPVSTELDLKKAASASGNKNAELIKMNELLPLTGYVRGGCSPIGMKKKYPVYIEESAQLFSNIYVSAGARGIQVKLSPLVLCEIVNGTFAELI